jgi:Low affinity iron permease
MLEKVFSRFASAASAWAGSPTAFAATAVIVAWALSGPVFGFSDVWQLTINTGPTIITFLIVFLIQNSQNRDIKALQVAVYFTAIPGSALRCSPDKCSISQQARIAKCLPLRPPLVLLVSRNLRGGGLTRGL